MSLSGSSDLERMVLSGVRVRKLIVGGAPVVHWVEHIPLRPGPYRRYPGLFPARCSLLHVFPSTSHTFLSYSLYNKIKKDNCSEHKLCCSAVDRVPYHVCTWEVLNQQEEQASGINKANGKWFFYNSIFTSITKAQGAIHK